MDDDARAERASRRRPRIMQPMCAIVLRPAPTPAEGELIYEQLACGHLGRCHGPTWSGTAAPLSRRPQQYTHVLGTRRRCATCAAQPLD